MAIRDALRCSTRSVVTPLRSQANIGVGFSLPIWVDRPIRMGSLTSHPHGIAEFKLIKQLIIMRCANSCLQCGTPNARNRPERAKRRASFAGVVVCQTQAKRHSAAWSFGSAATREHAGKAAQTKRRKTPSMASLITSIQARARGALRIRPPLGRPRPSAHFVRKRASAYPRDVV